MINVATTPSKPLDLVFVYGTLLEGLSNHRVLNGAEKVGEAVTEANYTMTATGIPYVSEQEGPCAIQGEVYRVKSKAHLTRLDELESHPIWYYRKPIRVIVNGEITLAWIYFNERSKGQVHIADGNYRNYVDNQKGEV